MAPHYEQYFLRSDAESPEAKFLKREAERRATLESQVQAILDKEGTGLKAPKIKVHVALIEHGTKKDAEDLKNELAQCQVFIPEAVGASPEHIKDLNDLAEGKITPRQLAKKEFEQFKEKLTAFVKSQAPQGTPQEKIDEVVERMLTEAKKTKSPMEGFNTTLREVIYNSKKKIAHVDLEAGDHRRINESMLSIFGGFEMVRLLVMMRIMPFQVLAAQALTMAQFFGRTQREREEHMLDGIAADIADFIKKDPCLRNRKEIKVFAFLGAWHRGVPESLKAAGDSVTTRTVKSGKYFGHLMEVGRKHRYGEPTSLDDGKRIVLETVFQQIYRFMQHKQQSIFWPIHVHGSEHLVARILADEFFDKAEEIYTDYSKLYDSDALAAYVANLVTSREAALKTRVDEWVGKLKNFKEVQHVTV